MDKPSTKGAINLFTTLKLNDTKTLVITPEVSENIFRSVSNLRYADHDGATGINILDLLHYTNLVVTTDAVKAIQEALA
jgi:large subunit ribosomal protein L4